MRRVIGFLRCLGFVFLGFRCLRVRALLKPEVLRVLRVFRVRCF